MGKIKINLSRLMGEKRYSIQHVADVTGLSRTTISNMYNEKIKAVGFETIIKLCDLFNCKIQDLIEFIPDEEKTQN